MQRSNSENLALISLIVAVISLPLVACGGWCCSPFPLISLLIGGYAFSEIKKETKKNDPIAIAAVAVSLLGFALIFFSTCLGIIIAVLNSVIR